MNRISSYLPNTSRNTTHPTFRATKRLHQDTESALRDIAYVLSLTKRVKAEILEERLEDNVSA